MLLHAYTLGQRAAFTKYAALSLDAWRRQLKPFPAPDPNTSQAGLASVRARVQQMRQDPAFQARAAEAQAKIKSMGEAGYLAELRANMQRKTDSAPTKPYPNGVSPFANTVEARGGGGSLAPAAGQLTGTRTEVPLGGFSPPTQPSGNTRTLVPAGNAPSNVRRIPAPAGSPPPRAR